MFDFSKTEAAKSTNFMQPGIYRLKVKDVKAAKLSNAKASDYLNFTFITEAGVEFEEKFFLSEKALGRIQYIYLAWTGKVCDKKFASIEEMEKFFAKVFTNAKCPAKAVIVGGQTSKDKVFANLPYTDFVITDESEVEYGPFEEGSALWKKYVTKSNMKSETEGNNSTILNDAVGTGAGTPAEEDKDDLPW